MSVLQIFHSDEGGDTRRPRFDMKLEGARKPRRRADEERRLFRVRVGGEAGPDSVKSLKNLSFKFVLLPDKWDGRLNVKDPHPSLVTDGTAA